MSEVKPLVAIHCLVYNHEPYLRDCFEGFVMQQTNFPFVAIVHDDASTDGSAAIIREYEEKYPQIFKPIYETENLYQSGGFAVINEVMNTAIKATRAKYVTICEGDDYWTDPLKLQKQVDFMEANPDYSMCFHAAEIKNETTTRIITTCQNIEEKEYFTNDIFPGWVVPTASVVYRRSMVDSFPPLKNAHWIKYGDIVLFLKCTHVGRVWGMKNQMSVYRMTSNGAVVSQCLDTKSEEKVCKHYQFLMQNFPQLNREWPSRYIAQHNYTKFRSSKHIYGMIKYFIVSFYFSPNFIFHKLFDVIKR